MTDYNQISLSIPKEEQSLLRKVNPYQKRKSKLQYQSYFDLSVAIKTIDERKYVINDIIKKLTFEVNV